MKRAMTASEVRFKTNRQTMVQQITQLAPQLSDKMRCAKSERHLTAPEIVETRRDTRQESNVEVAKLRR